MLRILECVGVAFMMVGLADYLSVVALRVIDHLKQLEEKERERRHSK